MKIRTVKNEEEWLALCEELRLRGKSNEPNPVMFHFNEQILHIPHDWDKEYLLIVKVGRVEMAEYVPHCTCECHKKDVTAMHFMACCYLTYEKYLDNDGTVDNELYDKLRMEHYQNHKAGGKSN